jgi:hypothetical protein
LRGESKPCWGRAVAGQGDFVHCRKQPATPVGPLAAAYPTSGQPIQPARSLGRVAARNTRRGFCHALGDELSTALGATAGQYGAAILRSHTCTEPVRARTPHFARLIGALHSMGSVDVPQASKRAARLSR